MFTISKQPGPGSERAHGAGTQFIGDGRSAGIKKEGWGVRTEGHNGIWPDGGE